MSHKCIQTDYWNMRAGAFGVGCLDCLQPATTLLRDCYRIAVTPAKRRRMELAQTKGYTVDTDGSDTFAQKDDRMVSLFLVLTDDEWERCA